MPDLRPVLFVLGLLLLAVAAAMLLPAAIDIADGNPGWRVFLGAAAITAGTGGALALGYREPGGPAFNPRSGFLLTVGAWVAVCAFAAIPFMLSERHLGPADAVFEAMSGLTTTGATVITGLESLPRGLLLWRILLHLIGGIGIIVMAVAILPVLRVGGMQLFRLESSDRSEKLRPRVSQLSGLLISVYATLAAAAAVLLVIAGLSPFDAVCHAISAVSTGGFSTRDLSVGAFANPAAEWIIAATMFLGGCTFMLLARIAQGDLRSFLRDEQTRTYAGYLAAAIALVWSWQMLVGGRPAGEALRASVFNTVSMATTTGFVTEDFLQWGSFPIALFFVLYFVGGCTGSTSGGVKLFRYCVLGSMALRQIRHLVHPSRVLPARYNGRPIADEVIRSVVSFFLFYIVAFAFVSLGSAAFGLDLPTAMSAAAQALGNVGPGLTDEIGPVGSYQGLPDGAKWLLTLAMLLGRLELLTVLVLLSPTYWRG